MSDKIKEKFGFDIDELGLAFTDFNLKEDKTYKSFTELARVQRESEQKAEFERATPKPEVIAQLLERGKALGAPQYKQDGTMTFDYFLASMKITTEFTINHT